MKPKEDVMSSSPEKAVYAITKSNISINKAILNRDRANMDRYGRTDRQIVIIEILALK